jgi:c-di-GMP-binding flagellar brake protein YcgR
LFFHRTSFYSSLAPFIALTRFNPPPMTFAQAKPDSDPVDFETLQLQVGTRLQIEVNRDLKQIQLFSTVIGWVKHEYLLLQLPMEGTQPFPLREADRLLVRVFTGMQVCWFHTTVLRIFMHPYLYMHVAFPREIGGRQLRNALRVKVNIPAKMEVKGEKYEIGATIRNVSIAGAALETAEKIPEQIDTIDLRFLLRMAGDISEMEVATAAAIRNRSYGESSDQEQPCLYAYGVQFVDLGTTQKLALQNLIYETLIMDRQKLA